MDVNMSILVIISCICILFVIGRIFIVPIKWIAKLILNEYVDVLSERGVDFDYDDSALRLLAKKSFNGKSGARDLRKLIRKEVEDKLASIIVENGGFTMSGVRLTGDEELQLKII